jgi:hypothetical protein
MKMGSTGKARRRSISSRLGQAGRDGTRCSMFDRSRHRACGLRCVRTGVICFRHERLPPLYCPSCVMHGTVRKWVYGEFRLGRNLWRIRPSRRCAAIGSHGRPPAGIRQCSIRARGSILDLILLSTVALNAYCNPQQLDESDGLDHGSAPKTTTCSSLTAASSCSKCSELRPASSIESLSRGESSTVSAF